MASSRPRWAPCAFWAKAASGFPARDIEAARSDLASGQLLHLETSQALSAELLATWNNEWPLAAIDDYARNVTSTRPDEVNAALATCARGLVGTITGDEKAIHAALAAPPPRPRPSP